jgi:hypothetical protein
LPLHWHNLATILAQLCQYGGKVVPIWWQDVWVI